MKRRFSKEELLTLTRAVNYSLGGLQHNIDEETDEHTIELLEAEIVKLAHVYEDLQRMRRCRRDRLFEASPN